MDPFLGFMIVLGLISLVLKLHSPTATTPPPELLLTTTTEPPTVEEMCSKESNVDLEEISCADEVDFLNNHEFRCYEKCLAIKHGLVEENGDPVIDRISDKYSVENKTELEEYIIQCSIRNQRPDLCDQVYFTSMCIGKYSIF